MVLLQMNFGERRAAITRNVAATLTRRSFDLSLVSFSLLCTNDFVRPRAGNNAAVYANSRNLTWMN